MNRVIGMVAVVALFSFSVGRGWARQQQAEQRPTLRRGKGSSERHNTSVTMNARALMRVRTIYIEPIENRLGVKIADDLASAGHFKLSLDKRQADAILSGTCLDATHLRLLHSEVFLSSRVTGAAIWQDEIRLPLDPPPLAKALNETASKIARDLLASAGAAENR